MGLEIVHRQFDHLIINDVTQRAQHQIVVDRVRMIKVVRPFHGCQPLILSERTIEAFLTNADHSTLMIVDQILAQLFHDFFADGRLTGSRPTAYADQKGSYRRACPERRSIFMTDLTIKCTHRYDV